MRSRKMRLYRLEDGARYGLLWVATGGIRPISVLLRPMLVDGFITRKCNRKILYILDAGVMRLCYGMGKRLHLVEVSKRDLAIGRSFLLIGSQYGTRSVGLRLRGLLMKRSYRYHLRKHYLPTSNANRTG